MARHRSSSLTRTLNTMARDAARYRREAEAAERRQVRDQQRQQRERARQQALASKEAKVAYQQARQEEVEDQNGELFLYLKGLQNILQATLNHDDTIQFSALRDTRRFPPFDPPKDLAVPSPQPQEASFTQGIKPPGALAKLFGAQAAYERAIQDAQQRYRTAQVAWSDQEAKRSAEFGRLLAAWEQERDAFGASQAEQHAEIARFEQTYRAGEPEAVLAYNGMVLEESDYPDGFPHRFRLAYAQESQELIVEYELPALDLIPTVAEYRYVKTRDVTEEKPRKPAEIKDLYADVVAAVALRTLHELFEADQGGHVQVLTFNGVVEAIDPATGQGVRPCLVSARTTRDRFAELNLARVDKKICLRNLGAQISARPDELQPVKPVVEFNMVDKRFIDSEDVLGSLDSRPNLLELSPGEFEHLVGNLFTQMGLETRMTRSSRDGGVDVVAYDQRPVLGGKVVIQAKRYRHTVSVSAVRDLYGTMMNEGANKGILVATSGYGKDAFNFAQDKPIELIDGARLLYLLEQVGTVARIVLPAE